MARKTSLFGIVSLLLLSACSPALCDNVKPNETNKSGEPALCKDGSSKKTNKSSARNWQAQYQIPSAAPGAYGGNPSAAGTNYGGLNPGSSDDNNGYIGKPPTAPQPITQPAQSGQTNNANSYQSGDTVSPGDISEDSLIYQPMEPTPKPPSQWQVQQEQAVQDLINTSNAPVQYEPGEIQSFQAEWSRSSKSAPQVKGDGTGGNTKAWTRNKPGSPKDTESGKEVVPVKQGDNQQTSGEGNAIESK